MSARERLAAASAALALACLPGVARPAGTGAADSAATFVQGQLHAAVWHGRGLGETWHGSACWLRGADGSVRVEVARHPGDADDPARPAWGRLLGRHGEGWVALLGAQTAVAGAWGEALAPLSRAARLRLEVLLALAESRAGEGPPALPAGVRAGRPRSAAGERRAAGPAAADIVLPEVASLRAALEARGRGRGGGGETWRVRAAPAAGGALPGVQIASSRLPGVLVLTPAGARPVSYPPDDVFVPVWPLGDLLQFPADQPAAAGGAATADGGS